MGLENCQELGGYIIHFILGNFDKSIQNGKGEATSFSSIIKNRF